MSWREQQQEASFRGVPFFVDAGDASVGRRSVPHEYPLRDLPYVEDMGRKMRQFRVDAVVIGADYMTQRDALLAAIEQPGPGKLVHPHYGEMTVSVVDCSASESTAQGGLARLQLVFLESGEFTFPSAQPDTAAVVEERADAAELATSESFTDRFDIAGLPAFALTSPAALVDQLVGQVRSLANFPLGDALQRGVLDALAGDLLNRVGSLLDVPSSLAQTVLDVIGALRGVAPTPATAVGALVQLAVFGNDLAAIPQTTVTRRREATNSAAMRELVQVAAVSQAAVALAGVAFDSFSQAQALRERVLEPLDAIAETTPDDATYAALMDLRAAVVRDVALRGADLARTSEYTPPATVPAIVLAYGLYEDPARETDLLARNAIAHPGFVPAGVPLEVLADA